MKEKKELIDEIVHRLKSKEDFPYREGAWERFRSLEAASHTSGMTRTLIKFLSSAAAVLLLGLITYFLVIKNKDEVLNPSLQQLAVSEDPIDLPQEEFTEKAPLLSDEEGEYIANPIPDPTKKEMLEKVQLVAGDLKEDISEAKEQMQLLVLDKANIEKINIPLAKQTSIVQEGSVKHKNSVLPSHTTFASNAIDKSNTAAYTNAANLSNSKSWRFQDKFDFGLFISPFTQSESFKIGAGFAVAYNLNSKLSIRTGASYNSYEVGILKNPLSSSSVEEVNARVVNSGLQSNGSHLATTSVSKLTIPNISAITGFVNSIEIPLEVKYNLNKSIYATAGVSYSTIVNQERNAMYIENIDNITFKNGFPENEKQASQALEVETKTVKSSENNVSTSGYNGFINMSFGKKVTINRKLGISVEPYFKIPVGEFRHSDMNYTNGGIRIITNF